MAFVLRNITRRPMVLQRCIAASSLKYVQRLSSNEAATDAKLKVAEVNPASAQHKLLVSDSCIKRLRDICKEGSFLRVTVEGGGCSGFQYKFELDNKLNEDDLQFGEDKAKVVIDNISLEYCDGATLDYHEELIRAGFRMLSNPLAEQGCSCGSSFSIKID